MAPIRSSVALFTILHLLVGALGESCYYPDGSTDSSHFACSTGGTSVCCAEGFQCLSNGLCNDYRYPNYERVLRGGCTDKNWGDGCPQTCTSIWPQGDEIVFVCSDGKFCCGRSNDCCNDSSADSFDFGDPQVIATAGKTQATSTPKDANDQSTESSQPTSVTKQDGTVAASKATSATGQGQDSQATNTQGSTVTGDPTTESSAPAASQTDASTTVSTVVHTESGPSTTNTVNDNNNTTTTTGASNANTKNTLAIAVGVGVGVGVLVFLVAAALFWRIRRRQRANARSRNIAEIGDSATSPIEVADHNRRAELKEKGRGSNGVFELDGHGMGAELPAEHEAGEVHGDSVGDKKWPGTIT